MCAQTMALMAQNVRIFEMITIQYTTGGLLRIGVGLMRWGESIAKTLWLEFLHMRFRNFKTC